MVDHLDVVFPPMVQPIEGSSVGGGECLVDAQPISTVADLVPAKSPITEVVEDSKEGIISNV